MDVATETSHFGCEAFAIFFFFFLIDRDEQGVDLTLHTLLDTMMNSLSQSRPILIYKS